MAPSAFVLCPLDSANPLSSDRTRLPTTEWISSAYNAFSDRSQPAVLASTLASLEAATTGTPGSWANSPDHIRRSLDSHFPTSQLSGFALGWYHTPLRPNEPDVPEIDWSLLFNLGEPTEFPPENLLASATVGVKLTHLAIDLLQEQIFGFRHSPRQARSELHLEGFYAPPRPISSLVMQPTLPTLLRPPIDGLTKGQLAHHLSNLRRRLQSIAPSEILLEPQTAEVVFRIDPPPTQVACLRQLIPSLALLIRELTPQVGGGTILVTPAVETNRLIRIFSSLSSPRELDDLATIVAQKIQIGYSPPAGLDVTDLKRTLEAQLVLHISRESSPPSTAASTSIENSRKV